MELTNKDAYYKMSEKVRTRLDYFKSEYVMTIVDQEKVRTCASAYCRALYDAEVATLEESKMLFNYVIYG